MKIHTPLLNLLSVFLMLWSCDDATEKTQGCGNGLVDVGEACDGSAGAAPRCVDLGYYGQNGPVTCGQDCQWELWVCDGRCGDGIIQVMFAEQCEGEDLLGHTCASLDLGIGTLACRKA